GPGPKPLPENPVRGTSVASPGVTGFSDTNVGVLGQSLGAQPSDGVLGVGQNGVHGQSAASGGSGVFGENYGGGIGVSGSTNTGTGVWGSSNAGNGVVGESQRAEGVRGVSHNSNNSGVVGICDQNNGVGVYGACDDGKGGVAGTGVWGKSLSSGLGVLGE